MGRGYWMNRESGSPPPPLGESDLHLPFVHKLPPNKNIDWRGRGKKREERKGLGWRVRG